VRATLHDELMRKAGFDVEHYQDLERRRQRRQRWLAWLARIPATSELAERLGLLVRPRGAGRDRGPVRSPEGEWARNATLNDRLMRDAGFPVGYYRERDRRRERRRWLAVRSAVWLLSLFIFAAFLVHLLSDFLPHVPKVVAAVAAVVVFAAPIVDWVARHVTQHEETH
jgi:hypothetical protein